MRRSRSRCRVSGTHRLPSNSTRSSWPSGPSPSSARPSGWPPTPAAPTPGSSNSPRIEAAHQPVTVVSMMHTGEPEPGPAVADGAADPLPQTSRSAPVGINLRCRAARVPSGWKGKERVVVRRSGVVELIHAHGQPDAEPVSDVGQGCGGLGSAHDSLVDQARGGPWRGGGMGGSARPSRGSRARRSRGTPPGPRRSRRPARSTRPLCRSRRGPSTPALRIYNERRAPQRPARRSATVPTTATDRRSCRLDHLDIRRQDLVGARNLAAAT
jgi:hypothetical protein